MNRILILILFLLVGCEALLKPRISEEASKQVTKVDLPPNAERDFTLTANKPNPDMMVLSVAEMMGPPAPDHIKAFITNVDCSGRPPFFLHVTERKTSTVHSLGAIIGGDVYIDMERLIKLVGKERLYEVVQRAEACAKEFR